MKFEKFQSLINESMKNVGGFLRDSSFGKRKAVVTEKIHGANFSVYFGCKDNVVGINFASRSQMLCPETNFMNCQRYFTEEKIQELLEHASTIMALDKCELRFIGEIYGGMDIAGIKPVQREVHYSGDIGFRVFHAQIANNETGEVFDYNWKNVKALASDFGFEVAPIVAEGLTFEQAYALDQKVKSALSDKDQICEGYCIRVDADGEEGQAPLIFKKRNTDFLETKGTVKAPQNTVEQTELGMEAMARIGSFITPQRVSNVNSHHGYSSPKDFQNLMAAVLEDVLDEYKKEYDVDLRNEPVWKEIKRSVGAQVVPLVREVLL